MANPCKRCGKNLDLVGRSHNCTPDEPVQLVVPAPAPAVAPPPRRRSSRAGTATYRYRDPDKWRAYMREYMKRRRLGLATIPPKETP